MLRSCIDVTAALHTQGENTLNVRVWDPTERGDAAARQTDVRAPDGIWYTPVSGIWQTVWLEPVSATIHRRAADDARHRHAARLTRRGRDRRRPMREPNDRIESHGSATAGARSPTARGRCRRTAGGRSGHPGRYETLDVPTPPILYDLRVRRSNPREASPSTEVGKLRRHAKISDGPRCKEGFLRLAAQRPRPASMFGPLDQGWWPDGLYTAPTDEALAYDIIKTKAVGVQHDPQARQGRTRTLVLALRPAGNPRLAGHAQRHGASTAMADGTNISTAAECAAVSRNRKRDFRKEWQEIMDLSLLDIRRVGDLGAVQRGVGPVRDRGDRPMDQDARPDASWSTPASGGNYYPDAGDMLGPAPAIPDPRNVSSYDVEAGDRASANTAASDMPARGAPLAAGPATGDTSSFKTCRRK